MASYWRRELIKVLCHFYLESRPTASIYDMESAFRNTSASHNDALTLRGDALIDVTQKEAYRRRNSLSRWRRRGLLIATAVGSVGGRRARELRVNGILVRVGECKSAVRTESCAAQEIDDDADVNRWFRSPHVALAAILHSLPLSYQRTLDDSALDTIA